MNMTITESDKKILGYLAAFLIVFFSAILIFRPLLIKNEELRKKLSVAAVEVKSAQRKQSSIEEIREQETQTLQQTKETLARFYPILESQEAEKMATTLLLNHHLQIQSLQVSMPEASENLESYFYAEEEAALDESEEEEEMEETLHLNTIRIYCVADGSKEDVWKLLDDLSENYPAISIAGAEWSSERITLNLEILMCNQ